MFVSTELAARIEKAEARLSAELGEALIQKVHDAFVCQIDGGTAVYGGPSSPINKMIGVGFDGLPSAAELEAVESAFQVRRAPLQAEVSTLSDPAVATLLSHRQYALRGFENVLGRPIVGHDADPHATPTVEIHLAGPESESAWLDVLVSGFLHPDAQGVPTEPLPPREGLQRCLSDALSVPGYRRYVARIEGQLAGAAALRLDDGLAQLCGAATLPAFRRRGIQTALLRKRLADAATSGCTLALMTTAPGSKSQENGNRQGFQLLYSRALLVKPPSEQPDQSA